MTNRPPSGMPSAPPKIPTPKLNINDAKLVSCDKCGNPTFAEVMFVFFISAIIAPEGKDTYAPMAVLSCNACGHINDEFVPDMLKKKKEVQPTDLSV